MSFTGPNPYGTPGGDELITAPQTPPLIRTGLGNSVILFLHVNGRLVERLRENVEDVVRILGLSGQVLVAIITREDSVVRDANASDMDFQDAFSVTQIAPGVVSVEIKNDGISSAMLQDALIQAIHLAPFAVTNGALADDAVDARVIAADAVGTSEIAAFAVTNGELGDASVDTRVLAPGAVPASGLTLIETRTLSGTAQSFNNVFTSTYDRYMVVGDLTLATISLTTFIRMRAGGADASGTNYRYWGFWLNNPGVGSTALNPVNGNLQAFGWYILGLTGGRPAPCSFRSFFDGPALARATQIHTEGHGVWAGLSWVAQDMYVIHELTTPYDGFTIYSSAAMSGTLSIYGMQKTP